MVHSSQSSSRDYNGMLRILIIKRADSLSSQPSPRVGIVKFQRGIQQGLLGRISRDGIREYHGFGIISEGIESGCHYMIVGVQGDWTRGIVNDPPKALYTREMKVRGFRFCYSCSDLTFPPSSPVFLILLTYTAVESGSVPVQV